MDTLRKMTETLSKDRDKAMERVRDVADTALEKGRETWEDLRGQGKEALAQAQKSTQEAWEDAEQLVRKHPGKAVGVALLVGVLIGGALVAMRKHD